eukprot:symbB.v1.2.021553.t2/scaffold1847.1/size122519/6
MSGMRALLVASIAAVGSACELKEFKNDDYAGSLIGGAIGGIVLALLMIILVSLPLCCGILKQSCWMVATFLASSSLTLLHLDGWLLCWALWLPPWRAVFAVNAAKPNLTNRRWSRSPSCQITNMLTLTRLRGWLNTASISSFCMDKRPRVKLIRCSKFERSSVTRKITVQSHIPAIVDMSGMRALLVASIAAVGSACELKEFKNDDYAGSLIGGAIGGIVLALLMIILVSLPLCCGILKQYGKIIGAIGIILGIVALAIPFLGSMGSCGPFVDAICDMRCSDNQCTEAEKKVMLDGCNILGFIFAYTVAFGWVAVVLGIMLQLLLLLQVVDAIHTEHGAESVSVVVDPLANFEAKGRRHGGPLVRSHSHQHWEPESRKLLFMASGASALVAYLGFLATEGGHSSKTAESEDRSLLGAWSEALQWMVLSMTLSIFNKWIFISDGANFPHPMTLSCCHMLATSVLLHSLREILKSWRLAKVVLLVGTLLSISVVLSNSAAVLLSVAFVNMLKGGNPVLALLLGLALGTASCTWQMLLPILVIMLGAVATIHGELSLSYLGLGLLVTAILIEQFRLVMFKSLMSEGGFSLDPLSALALFSPVASIFTFLAAMVYEHGGMGGTLKMPDLLQGTALALNSLVAVTLNIAYSRLLKVASPVTFTVFGTAKDVATAGLSLFIVGGTVTPQQLCGYGTTLLGMIYYDRLKQQRGGWWGEEAAQCQYSRERLLSLRRFYPNLNDLSISLIAAPSPRLAKVRGKPKPAPPPLEEKTFFKAAPKVDATDLLPEWVAPHKALPNALPPGFAFDAPPMPEDDGFWEESLHPGNEVATTALHALLGIGTGPALGPAWPPFEPLAAPGLAPVAPGLAPVALQPMADLQEAEAQPMKAEPREEGVAGRWRRARAAKIDDVPRSDANQDLVEAAPSSVDASGVATIHLLGGDEGGPQMSTEPAEAPNAGIVPPAPSAQGPQMSTEPEAAVASVSAELPPRAIQVSEDEVEVGNEEPHENGVVDKKKSKKKKKKKSKDEGTTNVTAVEEAEDDPSKGPVEEAEDVTKDVFSAHFSKTRFAGLLLSESEEESKPVGKAKAKPKAKKGSKEAKVSVVASKAPLTKAPPEGPAVNFPVARPPVAKAPVAKAPMVSVVPPVQLLFTPEARMPEGKGVANGIEMKQSVKAPPGVAVKPAPPKAKAKAVNGAAKVPMGINPLPQQIKAKAPVANGWNPSNLTMRYAERPVEKVSANGYYEEEVDPDLQCYIWDSRSQQPRQPRQPILPGRSSVPNTKKRLLLNQVMEMGFSEADANRALSSTGWSGCGRKVEGLNGNCGSPKNLLETWPFCPNGQEKMSPEEAEMAEAEELLRAAEEKGGREEVEEVEEVEELEEVEEVEEVEEEGQEIEGVEGQDETAEDLDGAKDDEIDEINQPELQGEEAGNEEEEADEEEDRAEEEEEVQVPEEVEEVEEEVREEGTFEEEAWEGDYQAEESVEDAPPTETLKGGSRNTSNGKTKEGRRLGGKSPNLSHLRFVELDEARLAVESWPSLPARPAPRRWTGRPAQAEANGKSSPTVAAAYTNGAGGDHDDLHSQLRQLEDENEELRKELSNEKMRVKQLQKLQVEAAQANHREFEAKKREASALRELEEAKSYVARRHTFALNEKAELLQKIQGLEKQLQEAKDREVALNLEAQVDVAAAAGYGGFNAVIPSTIGKTAVTTPWRGGLQVHLEDMENGQVGQVGHGQSSVLPMDSPRLDAMSPPRSARRFSRSQEVAYVQRVGDPSHFEVSKRSGRPANQRTTSRSENPYGAKCGSSGSSHLRGSLGFGGR